MYQRHGMSNMTDETPYSSCLTSEKTYHTTTIFKQQNLVYQAPGRDHATAAEFAVVNFLRAFTWSDLQAVVDPILVEVRDRSMESEEQRKKKKPTCGFTTINVRVNPTDPKRTTGPGWSVSAVF